MEMVIHSDLVILQELVYEPNGFLCTNIVQEAESEEYGAYTFEMNHMRIKFRVAKITPTKTGQFVTLWKRGNKSIIPYDLEDPVDFFIISVRSGEHFGQFIFPKSVLHEKGIVSKEGQGGKRAIRVYPPWDKTESRQAKNTQTWQLNYFFQIDPNGCIDSSKLQKLFN